MKKKILIIDDEADIRDVVRLYLTEEHYEVIEAGNGQEGILAAQREKPDLIVLDIMMPGINGFEVAKHLKDDPNTNHIPILILSVLGQEPHQYRQGFLDYISKPFQQKELLEVVTRILAETNGRKNQKRVLIVDDEADIVDIISICLKDNDLECEKAYNGAEALEIARNLTLDLILLDINMPGMNGFEVTRRLKEDQKTCDIPIVVLTGTHIPENDRREGLTLGIRKYLTKPFSADILVKEIKEVLLAQR